MGSFMRVSHKTRTEPFIRERFAQDKLSAGGTRLPPMWSEFDSNTQRHLCVEFRYSASRGFPL